MFALLSAIFGFAAPFLPEVFKLARGWQDNAHEIQMFEMRMKYAEAEAANQRCRRWPATVDIAPETSTPKPNQAAEAISKPSMGRNRSTEKTCR